MSEWKPIETAPKDGTEILLSVGRVVGIGRFRNGIEGKGFYLHGNSLMFYPSYWAEIPEPPND